MFQAFVNYCWKQSTDRVINPCSWVSGPVGDFCRAADDGPGRNRIMNDLIDALEADAEERDGQVSLCAVLNNPEHPGEDERVNAFLSGMPTLYTYGGLQLVLAKLGLPPSWQVS